MVKEADNPILTFLGIQEMTFEQIAGLCGHSNADVVEHPAGFIPGPEFYAELQRKLHGDRPQKIAKAKLKVMQLGFKV